MVFSQQSRQPGMGFDLAWSKSNGRAIVIFSLGPQGLAFLVDGLALHRFAIALQKVSVRIFRIGLLQRSQMDQCLVDLPGRHADFGGA